jgi:hypothetical protein
LLIGKDRDEAGVEPPLLESADQLLSQEIGPDGSDRVGGDPELLQMISYVDRCPAGKEPTRKAIPENFTKAEDGGHGWLSHRLGTISNPTRFCKQI